MISAPTGLIEVNGQPAVQLRAPDGAAATVLLHGAHIVSWVPAGSEEQLYLSPATRYGEGHAVRGGVPVCFPQFSDRGPLPKHGFARTRAWAFDQAQVRGEHAFAVLRLVDDAATRALWPFAFAAELTISVSGGRLDIELAVTNTGDATLEFTAALHTYLHSFNVLKTQLEGLQGATYYDHVAGVDGKQQWIDVLTVAQEMDRIYWQAPQPLLLREPGRRVEITTEGFEDTVVWNPGPQKCALLVDMPPEGWRDMLCVEAAQIGAPVRLAPGQEWAGMQTLISRV
ncbi:MAG: D-hexose-6-phosphate mutarotase [Burkholderiales bacterium]